MKLSKTTTILINVALVLLIVILMKAFITIPQHANAAPKKQYMVRGLANATIEQLQAQIGLYAQQGWNLFSAFSDSQTNYIFFILER